MGASTPCVWGDKIFLTSADGDDVVLLCVGTDGKEKWKQKLSEHRASRPQRPGPRRSDASASCTHRRQARLGVRRRQRQRSPASRVDGKPVWENDLQKYGKFNIQFGCHWTPVLYKGRLYLQVMHRNAQKLVCLDAAHRQGRVEVDRPGYVKVPSTGTESPDVYASAFIWEGEGGPLLVAHGNDYCTGHKLDGRQRGVAGAGPEPDAATGRGGSSRARCSRPDLIVVPSCKNGPTVAFNPVGAKGDIDPENKAELWRLTDDDTFRTPDVVTPIRVGDIVYISGDGPFCGPRGEDRQADSTARQLSRGTSTAANMVDGRREDLRHVDDRRDGRGAGRQGVQEAGDQHPAGHALRLARPSPTAASTSAAMAICGPSGRSESGDRWLSALWVL